jgi:hypothetical protein
MYCLFVLQAVFVYDDWLEGKAGDPKTSVTLKEATTPEARAARKAVSMDAL